MKVEASLLKLTYDVGVLFGIIISIFISGISGNSNNLRIREPCSYSNITILNYHINLTVDPALQEEKCNVYLTGETYMEMFFLTPMHYITLNAQREYVDVYNASIYMKNGPSRRVKRIVHDNEEQSFKVYFDEDLMGHFILKILFRSCASDNEVFKISYKGRMLWTATHLLPTRARALFPCLDDPRIKTPFTIGVTLDTKHNVVSNVKTLGSSAGEYMNTVYFPSTPSMSTYDVAIAMYDKNLLDDYKVRYKSNVTNYTRFALDTAAGIAVLLRKKWIFFRDLISLEFYQIPGFPYDAMKKPGIVIFREDAMFYKVGMDPVGTKINVARFVARVVIHERMDLLANPTLWSRLWLHEGIGMLLGQEMLNQFLPELRLLDFFSVQFQSECMHLDIMSTEFFMSSIIPIIRRDTRINSLFSFTHYIKVPVILNMFRRIFSDDIFWKGVQNYFSNNIKEANFEGFCYVMQDTIDETPIMAHTHNYNVRDIMKTWATQMYYPVLNVTAVKNATHIRIEGKNHIERMDYIWLTITTQSEFNFALTGKQFHTWVGRKEEYVFANHFISRNNDDWLIVNLQQIGYYRVNYDAENWQRLTSYLNSENYTKIPFLNRAQLVNDAFYFLTTGQIDPSIFFNLINYLQREIDYLVWYPVFKHFEYMSAYLPFQGSTFFKNKLEPILSGIFNKLMIGKNFDNNHDLNDCLRQEVAKWACIFGSQSCRKSAKMFLELEIHGHHRITLPWWEEWIYSEGLTMVDDATWEKIFDLHFNRSDNKMLRYLVCTENVKMIKDYIDLTTSDIDVQCYLRAKGIKTVIDSFHYVIARHSKNSLVREHIFQHFNRVVPRQINTVVAFTDIINHIYSQDDLIKIRHFVSGKLQISQRILVMSKLQLRYDQLSELMKENYLFSNIVPKLKSTS